MKWILNWCLLIITLLNFRINAQQKDPYKILNLVSEEFNLIEDYTVDITINVYVEFLKAPNSKAKIYFKQPDKIKVESEGFAMLPKQGIDFSPAKLLDGNYTAIYSQQDSLDSIPVDIIKVIPDMDSSGIILSKLWIDPKQKVIRKIESTSKSNGTFSIDLFYKDSNIKILPSEVIFKFDLGGLELPSSFTGNFDSDTQPVKKDKTPIEGIVIIKYYNYIINQNLSDTIFESLKE